MPIREGMTYIIALIRQFAHVTTEDMTLGGITYWSDEQLQDIADRHLYPTLIPLSPTQVVARSIYKLICPRHYYFEGNVYEADVLVGENLYVYSQSKTPVSSTFTYDPNRGTLTFDSELSTSCKYYMQGSAVNLYEALAELWGLKAAQRFDYIKFAGGDNKMEHDQEYMHCLELQTHYRNLIGKRLPRVTKGTKWSVI